jgi:hypothetical protein
VRIEWEGSRRFRRTAEAVLTDGRGTPVPLVLDIGSMAGLRRPASRGWLRLLPAAARKVAGVVEGEAIVFQEPDCRGGLP